MRIDLDCKTKQRQGKCIRKETIDRPAQSNQVPPLQPDSRLIVVITEGWRHQQANKGKVKRSHFYIGFVLGWLHGWLSAPWGKIMRNYLRLLRLEIKLRLMQRKK